MTPMDLSTQLAPMPADAPLIFATPDARIREGYHVTEFEAHQIASIDCGARVSRRSEAALQLWDGAGAGSHMTVGRFRGILDQSLSRLPELGDLPLHVTFAPQNEGLHRYTPQAPVHSGDEVHIALSATSALCRPLAEGQAKGQSCCA